MTRTSVHQEVIEKIEELDLSISVAKQVYIKALRGNLTVGSVDIRILSELYDDLTTLSYIAHPTYKDFIEQFIKASIHQSLLRAGYEDPDLIYNTSDFRRELHEVLLAADWDCEVVFEATIYFHILPVELGHPQPVSLFYQVERDEDEFTVDGVSYSVLPDDQYMLNQAIIGEFQAIITLFSVLNSELSSEVEPCSITIALSYWSHSGIDILDEVLWDGLFSYNTDSIYGWLSTYPYFTY